MDEFELIGRIRERLRTTSDRAVVGNGDDAAVLRASGRDTVLSVDVAVEGVHFDARWLSPEDIGWRAYVAALSDLAAMGATPVAGLVSLILPPSSGTERVLGMADGIEVAAAAFAAPVVGGNVSSGATLSLTSTVIGEPVGRALRRDGAQVGDGVFVTGPLGGAAAGWRLLAAGLDDEASAACIATWRRPRPRFDVVAELAQVATAAIDISDGLASDLGHVLTASGVSAELEAERVPFADSLDEQAPRVGTDALSLALGGGEDYELVFTAPPERVAEHLGTRVGTIVAGRPHAVWLTEDGTRQEIVERGHRHEVARDD